MAAGDLREDESGRGKVGSPQGEFCMRNTVEPIIMRDQGRNPGDPRLPEGAPCLQYGKIGPESNGRIFSTVPDWICQIIMRDGRNQPT